MSFCLLFPMAKNRVNLKGHILDPSKLKVSEVEESQSGINEMKLFGRVENVVGEKMLFFPHFFFFFKKDSSGSLKETVGKQFKKKLTVLIKDKNA